MGNRLSKIYTQTGDDGSTGLADGARVLKNSATMHAIGTVDELNSHIGLLRALLDSKTHTELGNQLHIIQHLLFNLGGELSMSDYKLITEGHSKKLEQWLDALNQNLPALKDFILPAGNKMAAQAHICRAVCRRAERNLVALIDTCSINTDTRTASSDVLTFINRLSDYLFVFARVVASQNNSKEVLWDKSILEQAKL